MIAQTHKEPEAPQTAIQNPEAENPASSESKREPENMETAGGNASALPETEDSVITEVKPELSVKPEAPPETDPEPPVKQPEEPQPPVENLPAEPEETEPVFDVAAVRAGLYHAKTLECLYAKAETEPLYPASMTKLVTACTALRYMDDMQEVIRVGTEMQFVQEGSSICWIREGHKLKMQDLVTGLLIASGNDAAYTIAVNVARRASGNEALSDQEAVEYFCGLMNEFVWDIGARNSQFTNPDGWDDEEQYTTVNDLAIIASCALKYPLIRDVALKIDSHAFIIAKDVTNVNGRGYTLER